MAPKSAYIFLALVSVMAVAVPIVTAIIGGWQPIKNPNAPDVVAIAKFAVAEHNKLKKKAVVLVSVVKGEAQVVKGINYKLLIATKEPFLPVPLKTHTAVVYSNLEGSLSLVSFN